MRNKSEKRGLEPRYDKQTGDFAKRDNPLASHCAMIVMQYNAENQILIPSCAVEDKFFSQISLHVTFSKILLSLETTIVLTNLM